MLYKPRTIFSVASIILVLVASTVVDADQRLFTDDGRQIVVCEDGRWEFVLNDNYATLPDGKRIRLLDDGRWEHLVKNTQVNDRSVNEVADQINGQIVDQSAPSAELQEAQNATLQEVPNALDSNTEDARFEKTNSTVRIELENVFLEEYSEKAGSVSKNKRNLLYLNFYLDVRLASDAPASLDLSSLSGNDFVVRDNRRRQYDVFIVDTSKQALDPGEKATLRLVTDGAPNKIFGAKTISLDVAPEALGSEASFELNYRDVDKKNISEKY